MAGEYWWRERCLTGLRNKRIKSACENLYEYQRGFFQWNLYRKLNSLLIIVHDPCIFLFETNDFGSQAGISKSSVPDPWHFGVIWIRIRGSMPLIIGSGPGSGRLFVFKAIFRRSVMYMRNKYPSIIKPRTGNTSVVGKEKNCRIGVKTSISARV